MKKTELNNYNLIEVKYLPSTNTQGSRVKLTSLALGESVTIAYNYSLNTITDMAADYLQEQGQKIQGKAHSKNLDYIILKPINNEFKSINNKFKSIKKNQ